MQLQVLDFLNLEDPFKHAQYNCCQLVTTLTRASTPTKLSFARALLIYVRFIIIVIDHSSADVDSSRALAYPFIYDHELNDSKTESK